MAKNKGSFKKGHKVNRRYEYLDGITPQKAYYERNREKVLLWHRINLQNKRKIALEHYGGIPPKCKCCGESIIEFLSFDHINGGGSRHRKTKKFGNIYKWLILNNFPDGFQVLCHNCNQAKGFYGKCPHATIKTAI